MIVLLAVILIAGLGSAALLTYFGVITTTADVSQSVILLGSETHTIPEEAPGGEEFCFLHKIRNDASVDITVGFETTPIHDGVSTGIYEVPETTTLTLENKDGNWDVISDGIQATLTFDTVSPTFDYTLTATGLQANKDYALIYYGDRNPRFNLWGGDNPGKVITTFTTDGVGGYTGSNSVDLGMNLPSGSDWNINPSPDYCDNHNGYDDYDHCRGAKIWIVPVEDLSNGVLPVKNWHPTEFLFETELITYSDCDLIPENFAVDMVKEEIATTTLNTKTKTTTPILVCYDFDVAISPGTYVITTKVIP